jgi:hypothetical protein
MTGEEARDILEEDVSRSVNSCKGEEGVGEVRSGAFDHASSLSGDGEVLAREPACPEGRSVPLVSTI